MVLGLKPDFDNLHWRDDCYGFCDSSGKTSYTVGQIFMLSLIRNKSGRTKEGCLAAYGSCLLIRE